MIKRVLCVIIMLGLSSVVWTKTLYPFSNPHDETRFQQLLKEIRCLVCQNQDLSDSHASLAKDLRRQIYHMVQEGKSDTSIKHYLTERYGDFILFKPPVTVATWMLWFGPFLFLCLGVWIVKRTCFKSKI